MIVLQKIAVHKLKWKIGDHKESNLGYRNPQLTLRKPWWFTVADSDKLYITSHWNELEVSMISVIFIKSAHEVVKMIGYYSYVGWNESWLCKTFVFPKKLLSDTVK